MLEDDMKLREQAKHLIEYAKHSKEEELDNVIKTFVNFVREQRIKILNETIQLLKTGNNETSIEERQRQETAKFSEGKTI